MHVHLRNLGSWLAHNECFWTFAGSLIRNRAHGNIRHIRVGEKKAFKLSWGNLYMEREPAAVSKAEMEVATKQRKPDNP